jgi:hypothetical protein
MIQNQRFRSAAAFSQSVRERAPFRADDREIEFAGRCQGISSSTGKTHGRVVEPFQFAFAYRTNKRIEDPWRIGVPHGPGGLRPAWELVLILWLARGGAVASRRRHTHDSRGLRRIAGEPRPSTRFTHFLVPAKKGLARRGLHKVQSPSRPDNVRTAAQLTAAGLVPRADRPLAPGSAM